MIDALISLMDMLTGGGDNLPKNW